MQRSRYAVSNALQNRGAKPCCSDKGALKKITKRDIVKLKRAVSNHPLASSKTVFAAAGVTMVSQPTQNKVLNMIGKHVNAPKPLSKQLKITEARGSMHVVGRGYEDGF